MDVKAKVVVGADGPHTLVGRWVGSTNRDLIPAVQVRLPLRHPLDYTEVYFDQAFFGGYGWLFPRGKEANVGIGMRSPNPGGPPLVEVLRGFIERLSREGKVVPRPLGWFAGWIPVGPPRRVTFENTMLVGDAAGHTHPITGPECFRRSRVVAWRANGPQRRSGRGTWVCSPNTRRSGGTSWKRPWRGVTGGGSSWKVIGTVSPKSSGSAGSPLGSTMQDLEEKLARARALSWENHGKRITFFLPGMFSYNGLKGRYPAISITGKACALQCDHCQGKTLEPMIAAQTGDALVETCVRLAERGNLGVLISGGCDREGRLPWVRRSLMRSARSSGRQPLYISIHCGLLDHGDRIFAQGRRGGSGALGRDRR
jgi:hypothetical protein